MINAYKQQHGNALFLILIAVVLFAALSYAITQSNRSGSNPSQEANLIASTTVTQYPVSVAMVVKKMLLRGVAVSELDFIPPDDAGFNDPPVTNKVFHPNGGGAIWQNVDPNTVKLDNNGVPLGRWVFGNNNRVMNIGTDHDGSNSEEAVARLSYVKKAICEQINEKLTGSKNIPTLNVDFGDVMSLAGNTITGAGIDGQPALCVLPDPAPPDGYVYYHVVNER